MKINCASAFLFVLLVLCRVVLAFSSLGDYVNNFFGLLGYKTENQGDSDLIDNEMMHKVPYEIDVVDERFISEAAKLTGIAISELDSCQHRVVLKLKAECHKLNDEQLAKMAVHLLNCQSYIEGRRVFPCTDEMSIKECTTNMDSDTWTSYHLMSNRAKAVCYMVRQTQFRGLAEHTVNRLLEASQKQLLSLGKIAHNQENIKVVAETTYDTLVKAHIQLTQQQQDMQKAQFHGQLILEDNIMKLVNEKRLIQDSHNHLMQMTHEVHHKLENSAKLIENQSIDNEKNHKELLEDIAFIQMKAENLFKKIDEYSEILLQQNEDFKNQYQATLKNLQEVNKTVHNLVNLVGGTRQALEERLSWIVAALGGTDQAVDRLYLVSWHVGFTLTAMLTCAFLSARISTRLVVASLPPLNLANALYGGDYMDFLTLLSITGALIAGQMVLIYAYKLKTSVPERLSWAEKETKLKPTYESSTEEEQDYPNLTPPISRADHYSLFSSRSRSNTPALHNSVFKGTCHARTRAGTPCKLSTPPNRDYCYRHQNDDSVIS